MPKTASLAKMLMVGGPDMVFSIKAHRILTYEINISSREGGHEGLPGIHRIGSPDWPA
jgi:hypothetical protein